MAFLCIKCSTLQTDTIFIALNLASLIVFLLHFTNSLFGRFVYDHLEPGKPREILPMNIYGPISFLFSFHSLIFLKIIISDTNRSVFQMNIHENSLGEGGEDGGTGSPVMYSGSSSRTNHASANGSIITMTLKNNHLIVETEERNVGTPFRSRRSSGCKI